MKTSIQMELTPLKLYKFHFKLMLRQAFTTNPHIPPHSLPPVHNPQVTLWVGRHYNPITNSCGVSLCTIPLCNAQWKKKGGGVQVEGGEKEWQTEPGKINTNVVSSWFSMSTTHHHLGKKYKWAERKKWRERRKILTASATPPSTTVTA